eukprot:8622344-Pyramimonas_sp.AAC.1
MSRSSDRRGAYLIGACYLCRVQSVQQLSGNTFSQESGCPRQFGALLQNWRCWARARRTDL